MSAYDTAICECHDPESLRREVFRLRDELRAAIRALKGAALAKEIRHD